MLCPPPFQIGLTESHLHPHEGVSAFQQVEWRVLSDHSMHEWDSLDESRIVTRGTQSHS